MGKTEDSPLGAVQEKVLERANNVLDKNGGLTPSDVDMLAGLVNIALQIDYKIAVQVHPPPKDQKSIRRAINEQLKDRVPREVKREVKKQVKK